LAEALMMNGEMKTRYTLY